MYNKLFPLVFLLSGFGLFAAPAPDFTITDSNGNIHHLYDDYINKGKVVVLEIFFVNCPPCATHAPFWQSLYNDLSAQYPGQVEFIMLSDKSADNNTAVAQYKNSKGLTMPAAGSNGGSLTAVQPYESGQFGPFYGTPTFVVITPGSGEVVFDIRGNSPSGTMDLISQEVAGMLLPTCLIRTYQGDTLQQYSMRVAAPDGPHVDYPVTNGLFSLESFPGLPALPFYLATPSKNDNPLNGVSTFDLVRINKQILGIETFQDPWQFIAADANASGTITTFDIVELRKLILGVYDTLPSVPSWVFSPTLDTISPIECPVFYAIKKGDVNGNADPAGAQAAADDRSGPVLPVLLENRMLEKGRTYRLPVRTGVSGQWQGLQMAWRFDPKAIQVLDVASALPGFDAGMWRLTESRLALSWNAAMPFQMIAGDPIVTIEVLALHSGHATDVVHLENWPLPAEAYDANDVRYVLEERGINPLSGGVIYPNPASGRFFAPLEGSSTGSHFLQLFDLWGRLAFEQDIVPGNGEQVTEVVPGDLSSGMYILRIDGRLAGKLNWQK